MELKKGGGRGEKTGERDSQSGRLKEERYRGKKKKRHNVRIWGERGG